jgi:hypothetical protein
LRRCGGRVIPEEEPQIDGMRFARIVPVLVASALGFGWAG